MTAILKERRILIGENEISSREEYLKQNATQRTYENIFGCRSLKVLNSGFLGLLLSNGFVMHMSVLFLELQDTFQKSKAETAIVQSMTSGTFLCGGLFSGLVLTKFGVIKAGLIGASLTVFGLAISFFATSIPYLVVSLGLMAGLGTSLLYSFATSYAGLFFKGKQKLLAFGVITTGAGLGGIITPYLLDYLSNQYGFRGALLVMSAVVSHMYVVVLLASNDIGVIKVALAKDSQHHLSFTISETFTKLVETLKNKIFIVYMASLSLTLSLYVAVLILFVDSIESKGYDRSTAVFVYSVIGIAALFSRPLPGALKNMPHISFLDIMILGDIIGSIGLGMLPVSTSFSMIICMACMFGISLGILSSMKMVGSMAILGQEKFAIGQGITLTLIGVLTIPAGPLTGLVKDVTDSYDWVFYCVCLISGITAVVLVSIRVIRKLKPALRAHPDVRKYPIDSKIDL